MATYYVTGIKKSASGGIEQLFVGLWNALTGQLEGSKWVPVAVVKKAIIDGHRCFTSRKGATGGWEEGAAIELHLTTHADHAIADNLRSLPAYK